MRLVTSRINPIPRSWRKIGPGIRAAYEAGRHVVVKDGEAGKFVARNPTQGWQTEFDGRVFFNAASGRGVRWIVLRGTAMDAERVEFKVGPGGFSSARGSASRWRVPVRLLADRTVVRVWAECPGGRSRPLRFVITRAEGGQ